MLTWYPIREMGRYITQREACYAYLEAQAKPLHIGLARYHQGTEDGEAIYYRMLPRGEWHFLIHLSPSLVLEYQAGAEALWEWVRAELIAPTQ